jgi:hypothetical protein
LGVGGLGLDVLGIIWAFFYEERDGGPSNCSFFWKNTPDLPPLLLLSNFTSQTRKYMMF